MAYSTAIRLLTGFGIFSLMLYSGDNLSGRCSAADVPSKNQSEEARITELLNHKMEIPPGIRYEKTTMETNRKAIDTLTNAFIISKGKVRSSDLLNEILVCGPGLWQKIKDDAQVKKITANLVTSQAVIGDGTPKMTGKAFRGKEEGEVFWQALLRQYKCDGQATIRRPTPEELQLYWAMIPCDIPEPIFIVESETATILTQFDKNKMQIFWIDDYSDESLFKEWLPELHQNPDHSNTIEVNAEPTKLPFITYSGYFVSNEFEPDAAESFVVIDDQEQFDKVFGVAMVMQDKSHRLPADAFKSNVVLAAIKRGNVVWEYTVEGVSIKDGVVELRYTITSTPSDSATFASPLIVSIPKDNYKAVEFVENEKPVKTVAVEKE